MQLFLKFAVFSGALSLIAGCTLQLPFQGRNAGDFSSCRKDCVQVNAPGEDTMRPKPRTEFRVAAVEGSGAEKLLGKTVAAIGDVTEAGFWLKTPLVDELRQGRIVWLSSGTSTEVVLRPLEAENASGSQISLDAMRALGLPFTALEEIAVYGN